ncbi:uncharacterized protein PRCAT00002326001 [Priceomyces carsonii]|uniref:uncharacterized protein n=1 Tax=Priceomyces carsonii TaxID=28549 RepID=UPI002EDB45FE|nr:unnamed protein product [Priceomyces carsonii]
MELLRHIGILFENDITLSDTILKLRGLFILYILFVVITGYNILSIACSICFCLFCESTNSLKRAAAALFWDLCLYFMVRINEHM